MEKFIIVKRERYNEYLIDEEIPKYQIIYREIKSTKPFYNFGNQVYLTDEPDEVYIAVECKYRDDFDLFVLYIMKLEVFIREYIHLTKEEYSELDIKKDNLNAIMNEFRLLRKYNKNCEDFYSDRCFRYGLDLGSDSSCIIGLMVKYFEMTKK